MALNPNINLEFLVVDAPKIAYNGILEWTLLNQALVVVTSYFLMKFATGNGIGLVKANMLIAWK